MMQTFDLRLLGPPKPPRTAHRSLNIPDVSTKKVQVED